MSEIKINRAPALLAGFSLTEREPDQMTEEEFTWPDPPGREWFESAGADVGATPQQIKFAAARFGGASASAAAKLAGYAGSDRALRSSGYAALRSNGVKRLLQLAESERVGTADIPEASSEEIKKTLSGLLRAPDPTIKLRAAEQLSKLDNAERAAQGEVPERSPDEIILEILQMGSLFVVAGLLFEDGDLPWGLAATPLVAPVVKQRYPDLWVRRREQFDGEGHKADFDALGDGPVLSVEAITELLAKRIAEERV
jgi:hypothetical protein